MIGKQEIRDGQRWTSRFEFLLRPDLVTITPESLQVLTQPLLRTRTHRGQHPDRLLLLRLLDGRNVAERRVIEARFYLPLPTLAPLLNLTHVVDEPLRICAVLMNVEVRGVDLLCLRELWVRTLLRRLLRAFVQLLDRSYRRATLIQQYLGLVDVFGDAPTLGPTLRHRRPVPINRNIAQIPRRLRIVPDFVIDR